MGHCVPMYTVSVFGLFVDKGVIVERDYEEYGCEDVDYEYLAGEWYVKYNPNVMDVLLSFQSKCRVASHSQIAKLFSKQKEIHACM